MPGERIEIDPVRDLLDVAEAVRISPHEHLFQNRDRLVQVVLRRNRLGDFLAVGLDRREVGGFHDRLPQRQEGVGVAVDEGLGGGEGTAGMLVPDVLRQLVDEADAVIDRALVERIRRQIPVDVFRPQVGDHFWRRQDADLDVLVGIQAVFGHIVAQQEVVHGILERHGELEALPHLRVVLVLVLGRQHDGLAVDVFHRRHGPRHLGRARPHVDRKRHRREHVRRVVFAGKRFVAGHGPAGRLDHGNVEAVLLIEAHGMGHDDRRGAGDGHEADVQLGLLKLAAGLGHFHGHGLGFLKREHGGDGGISRPRTHRLEERPAVHVAAEQSLHDGRLDGPGHGGFQVRGLRFGVQVGHFLLMVLNGPHHVALAVRFGGLTHGHAGGFLAGRVEAIGRAGARAGGPGGGRGLRAVHVFRTLEPRRVLTLRRGHGHVVLDDGSVLSAGTAVPQELVGIKRVCKSAH